MVLIGLCMFGLNKNNFTLQFGHEQKEQRYST